MVKDARVDVILQRINEDIGNEIDVEPTHIRRYGVNNIFQRVFSYLLGWKADGKPVKLAATMAGVLKTAATGAGLEAMERNPTSDTDGWITIVAAVIKTETFSEVMSVVDIMTKSNELYVQLSADGITFQGKKLLRGDINHMKSVDFSCKSVRIINVDQTGANDGSYEVVGYK